MQILFKTSMVFYVLLQTNFSLGVIQYKPIASDEKSSLYLGTLVNKDFQNWEESFSTGYSFKYHFLIPKQDRLLPKPLRDFLKVSLGVGGDLFKEAYSVGDLQCSSLSSLQTLISSAGVKVALPFIAEVVPFVELGMSRSDCLDYDETEKKVDFEKSSMSLGLYKSVGVFLSLKLLEKVAVYGLDRDYGINDVGILAQCSWVTQKEAPSSPKNISYCELGLSLSL